MRILIDADGCPVVDITVKIANKYNVKCLILCDTSHHYNIEGAHTITVSKGDDSVDFALVNMVEPGDIVITQDYGLAAMCLAKRALVINQNGMQYTSENIDGLLHSRHVASQIRRSGGRLKGPSKRRPDQDTAFESKLVKLLEGAHLEGAKKERGGYDT